MVGHIAELGTQFGIQAGTLRLGMAYLASALARHPGTSFFAVRYLKPPSQALGLFVEAAGAPLAQKERFMQQSSFSSNNLARQLPFGPNTLILGAAALVGYALTRRSKVGTALAAAGGLLAYRAARSSTTQDNTKAVFLVNASPDQAYKLWRNFGALPQFMVHLKSVRELDARRSEWVAIGPAQREIRWNAEITEDTPNERIAWRSLPHSDVQTSGSVDFRPDSQGRGTFVTANVQYALPGGPVATLLASLFGKNPEFVVREDVRRFKQLLEAGEVSTTRGQTHGPRGIHGSTEQVLFRENINLPDPIMQPEYSRSA